MSENRMSDILRASIEGARSFTENDTVMGRAINTPSGVTVIPVSKMTVGFASGGVDYGSHKNMRADNFGGGGGTAVSLTPIAFLTVGPNAEINLIPVSSSDTNIDKVASLIEKAPELIEKIRGAL